MALLHGRAGRLTAKKGGLRPRRAVNTDGADRVEALFRREFFNESLC